VSDSSGIGFDPSVEATKRWLRVVRREDRVEGLARIDDVDRQLHAVEPAREHDRLLVVDARRQERVVGLVADLALADDEQRARIVPASFLNASSTGSAGAPALTAVPSVGADSLAATA
jgi:hypothetical protein